MKLHTHMVVNYHVSKYIVNSKIYHNTHFLIQGLIPCYIIPKFHHICFSQNVENSKRYENLSPQHVAVLLL